MNTLDIKQLLPELKKQVTLLAEDLLKRASADATINNGLKEAFQQIEKGGRTAQAYEVWLEDYLDQVAVAWVLACVFVRFIEDNGLIDECWLAGEGERRKLAEDTHTLFFRAHPRDSDREYFQHVFHEVGKIPAAADLFAEGKTPLWAVAPSGDAVMNLLKFWREMEAATGHLKRSFQVESGDTRFLGDLYQDLSERAKKKFALLQTPVFVEEFILDRTLTPALADFGLEKVRMIDPTCGSGHFLLGGFARLFKLWSRPERTTGNVEKDAQKALDGVWGVDINPFAVAIARFRLIVAAVQACGIEQLKKAPGWKIHVATGDSLLFGKRFRLNEKTQGLLRPVDKTDDPMAAAEFWAPDIYACEEKDAVLEILGQQYHAVVGNPPYIIVRDRVLNTAYRELYSACGGKYSLGVPFTQRFWELSIQSDESNSGSGYVGLITTNSFMKREFGKKLIEDFFPKLELTHVIDTSGAYIPGHGTPTVILFGRNRKPTGQSVRAVQGIKGEPSTPEDASQGFVWQSILKLLDRADSQNDFVSTADVSRATFASHPWSIGGGGASELKDQLEDACEISLGELADSIGYSAIVGDDDAYVSDTSTTWNRKGILDGIKAFAVGDCIRDWSFNTLPAAIYPYNSIGEYRSIPEAESHFWRLRTLLKNGLFYRQTKEQRGLNWRQYAIVVKDKFRRPEALLYAFISSHNHFVFDRKGFISNKTAPGVKLPVEATVEDHLALLGFLNSSTVGFWMKQVSQQRQLTGGDGVRVTSRAQVPYEFSGTQLYNLPIPESFQASKLRERLLCLAKEMDRIVADTSTLTAERAISRVLDRSESGILDVFASFLAQRALCRSYLVFLQEEIDFTCYTMFGLAADSLLCEKWEWPTVQIDAGMRPFEILQQRNLDGFFVPKDVPSEWPVELQALWRKRMEAIRSSKDLLLIEDDHYKRRWLGRQGLFNHTARQDELKSACEIWLLDRLETPKYRKGKEDSPELTTTALMADVASADAEFLQVAAIYRGRPDFDVAALVADLVEGEAVPFLPILRYKPTGLRKREVWERTWDLQRQQDAAKDVGEIPVPPKYISADFLKTDFWRLRGKLDVPKERWVSYPHGSTDSDPTLVVGWSGWNHLEHATALVAYYDARKREGWTAERLKPLLAGLDQLIPWIHQWHPEVDPEYGETAGQSFQNMLESDAHELGLTLDNIRQWTPPEKPKKASSKKVKG